MQSLPSDSGSDVEVVADDRKSKLDARRAAQRAGKPQRKDAARRGPAAARVAGNY